jgi:hypothetical protein
MWSPLSGSVPYLSLHTRITAIRIADTPTPMYEACARVGACMRVWVRLGGCGWVGGGVDGWMGDVEPGELEEAGRVRSTRTPLPLPLSTGSKESKET